MMKEYFIATSIFVGLVSIIMVLSFLFEMNYDTVLIQFMLTYLVIDKLAETIRKDK